MRMDAAFNDVLDYGRRILDSHRQWYVDRRLPALVKSGVDPVTAQECSSRPKLSRRYRAWTIGFLTIVRGTRPLPCVTVPARFKNFGLSRM